MSARLREHYLKNVLPVLMKDFGFTNVMAAPKVEKVTVNSSLGPVTMRREDHQALTPTAVAMVTKDAKVLVIGCMETGHVVMTVNTDPSPGVDATWTDAPIRLHKRFTMVRPRPRPSCAARV